MTRLQLLAVLLAGGAVLIVAAATGMAHLLMRNTDRPARPNLTRLTDDAPVGELLDRLEPYRQEADQAIALTAQDFRDAQEIRRWVRWPR